MDNNNQYPNGGRNLLLAIIGFIVIIMIIVLKGDQVLDLVFGHEKAIMIGFWTLMIVCVVYETIRVNRKPKKSNYNKLADGRTMIDAKVVDVEKYDNSELPSRVIVAEGLDPKTGEKTLYRSKPFVNFIVGISEIKGRTVPVFVSNKNPKNYIVDISDIEVEAWEKQHLIKEKMEEAELKEVDKVDRLGEEVSEDPISVKNRKKKDLIMGIVIIFMALAFAVNAMKLFGDAWIANQLTKDMKGLRVSNGETTTATITSVTTTYNTEEDAEEHKVMVEYEVDGKKYEEELNAYSEEYEEGVELEIIYDSKDPTKIMPAWGKVFALVFIIPIFQGIVLACVAIGLFMLGVKIIKRE